MTNKIYNKVALLLVAPILLLCATACSEDVMNVEQTQGVTKGYALHVTVNATHQGSHAATRADSDGAKAATRADYDESAGTMAFSDGDQLFIQGAHETAGTFAGTLTFVTGTEGFFTGTIYTTNEYTGTNDALLTDATTVSATLLPNDYATYSYLSVSNAGTASATLATDATKALCSDANTAVEQFSLEQATTYTSGTGFALTPQNAILDCTISGLTASTAYTFTVSDGTVSPSRSVTTDASGKADFGVAFTPDGSSKSYTISYGDKVIDLGTASLSSGYIYYVNKKAE